jgi:histone H3/H4
MTEELKYEIIKKLVETNGNKKAAALKLNCTQRHVNRLIKGYLEEGKAFFQHGNKGRKPVNSIDVTSQFNRVGFEGFVSR